MTAAYAPAISVGDRLRDRVLRHGRAAGPGAVPIALMIAWAAHDGGYDTDTWYWGALVTLAVLAPVLLSGGWRRITLSRPAGWAVAALAAYVAWSYASIAWAQSPGDALQGSNRALLYLLVFTLMVALPWTAEAALAAFVSFALAVGVIAVVILLKLASAVALPGLLSYGRLTAPTGYFNSSAALFSIGALMAIALASRRELPGLLRGCLIAAASASLQLALVAQSRGWLFTLPLVVVATLVVVPDRLRVVLTAVLPVAATLIPVHLLLALYRAELPGQLNHAARQAGRGALIVCATMLVAGTLIAWSESLLRPPALSVRTKRAVGWGLVLLVCVLGVGGAFAATHGDPSGYISRQWQGFSRPTPATPSASHFAIAGSGRHDIWRVALDAFVAHPIGGLGQDNFVEFFDLHRRISLEPSWTHSLELRLLAHTGLVGFVLIIAFVCAAVRGAVVARRSSRGLTALCTGVGLLPLIVWLVHGSVDWFWEVPALSGPAFGFLAVSVALGAPAAPPPEPPRSGRPRRVGTRGRATRRAASAGAAVGFVVLVIVLGLPYLSVREQSRASDMQIRNPLAALGALSTAADLNPLSADPARLAGAIALRAALYPEAEERFRQAIARDPGGWFAWFGDGLAASALGNPVRARRDFVRAASINSDQRAVRSALARVDTVHPLTPPEALAMLTVAR